MFKLKSADSFKVDCNTVFLTENPTEFGWRENEKLTAALGKYVEINDVLYEVLGAESGHSTIPDVKPHIGIMVKQRSKYAL